MIRREILRHKNDILEIITYVYYEKGDAKENAEIFYMETTDFLFDEDVFIDCLPTQEVFLNPPKTFYSSYRIEGNKKINIDESGNESVELLEENTTSHLPVSELHIIAPYIYQYCFRYANGYTYNVKINFDLDRNSGSFYLYDDQKNIDKSPWA